GYHYSDNWDFRKDLLWTVHFMDTSAAAVATSGPFASRGSHASKTLNVECRFQQQSLEWSLDSGLGLMLQGTPNLVAIDLHQQAHRIGRKELEAMMVSWPELKHLGIFSRNIAPMNGAEAG